MMIDATPNLERIGWWLEDLRSGEFEQCVGELARDGEGNRCSRDGSTAETYCCLGVAAITALKHGFDGRVDWTQAVLQTELRAWYGFERADPVIYAEPCDIPDCKDDTAVKHAATSLNDGKGWTFLQIADAAEKYFGLSPVAANV